MLRRSHGFYILYWKNSALRGGFLFVCPKRNQWPRPPSLAPSGQFTLKCPGGCVPMNTSPKAGVHSLLPPDPRLRGTPSCFLDDNLPAGKTRSNCPSCPGPQGPIWSIIKKCLRCTDTACSGRARAAEQLSRADTIRPYKRVRWENSGRMGTSAPTKRLSVLRVGADVSSARRSWTRSVPHRRGGYQPPERPPPHPTGR